jgi:hypothetical protein
VFAGVVESDPGAPTRLGFEIINSRVTRKAFSVPGGPHTPGDILAMSADSKILRGAVPRFSKSPKLREARFEDYSQVAALATRFHLQFESFPGWTHLWVNNPAYLEIKDEFPIGWVLENGDGGISGYVGNVPLHYEFEGKKLLAAAGRCWVVDTPYRLYSLSLLETYFQQRNVDLFMNTSINALAAPAYDIYQEGVPVPVSFWDRTAFWITSPRGFTESFLRRKGWVMAKPLSYPLSASILLRDRLRGRRFQENEKQVTVRSAASFDDRFDVFWEALRRKKCNLLLGVRSREVLKWHFRFALLQNTAWIYVVEGNSGLLAEAVFLRQDSPEIGLTRVRLGDFQCLDQEKAPALLTAMLQVAVDRCREESIHMLELIGLSPQLEKQVERSNPRHRPLLNWMYCYKATDPMLAAKLKNPAVWEPSLFDGDSSL